MNYDALTLDAVTCELARSLVGGRIERVSMPEPLDVVLRVFTENSKVDLLMSCDPKSPRMHVTQRRRENPPNPFAFCMLLRKHLDGARITGFKRPMGDAERVVAIELEGYESTTFQLVVELMGKHSNVILLTGIGMILGAAKHITDEINRYREVLPGIPYRLPPKQPDKRDPVDPFTGDDAPFADQIEAARWLSTTYVGVSPTLAREAAQRAAGSGDLTRFSSASHLAMIVRGVLEGVLSPVVLLDDGGHPEAAYPIRLLSVAGDRQQDVDTINSALDIAWISSDERGALESSRTALVAALHKAERRREHEIEEVGAGLANAVRAEEYQQNADLIQANRAAIERGLESIEVDDYYRPLADGTPSRRAIPLDTTLDAGENADRYYKKARKARESVPALAARKVRLETEVGTLRSATAQTIHATTVEEIDAIHERVSSLLARQGRPASSEPEPAARFDGHRIRTFRSVDGWEILVGENATSNDYLTTKIARPSDIWLHVRAATSSHGVILSQNRPASVSQAALTLAAEMVAARSEVKHSSLIPVDYTLKKYVRKPRKSAPGAVTYANEKTIYVSGIA